MDFTLYPRDIAALVALGSVTVGFIVYWFASQSVRAENYFAQKYANSDERSIYFTVFQRYTGVIFLGILPTIFMLICTDFSWSDYGVKIPEGNETWYWVLGLGVVVVPINYWNAQKTDNLLVYPQIRAKIWTKWTFFHEYSSWIAYLLAYELLFRGFLLFSVYKVAGVWVTVLVNVSLYATTHIPKGQKEAIGAIPLGLLLSYVTLKTGNIWIAVLVHTALALSNSLFSFLAQPTMRYQK